MMDIRYTLMKERFKTLSQQQLIEMRDSIDITLFDADNYKDGKFCPMGIALDCHKMENPTDASVKTEIGKHYQPTNMLKGVEGSFYHGTDEERKRDLLGLLNELIGNI